MGIKIKKDTKPQLQNLPKLHIKYNLVVAIMGIVDILTMGSFYMNPATDGRTGLKLFFVLCALIAPDLRYGDFSGKQRWTEKRSA